MKYFYKKILFVKFYFVIIISQEKTINIKKINYLNYFPQYI